MSTLDRKGRLLCSAGLLMTLTSVSGTQLSEPLILVGAGTDLATMSVGEEVNLDLSSPERSFTGLDVPAELTSPEADPYLGFKIHTVIRIDRDLMPSVGETTLGVGLNGLVIIQLIIRRDGDQITTSSTGWIDGRKQWIVDGDTLDLTYANYLQNNSSASAEDVLTFRLRGDAGVSMSVKGDSQFVVDSTPGKLTTIEVDKVLVRDSNHGREAVVRYTLRSDRAKSALVWIDEANGLDLSNLDPVRVSIVDGSYSGSLTVPMEDPDGGADGVLVAHTDFNDPATRFVMNDKDRRGLLPWVAGFALLLATVVAWWLSRQTEDPEMPSDTFLDSPS